MGLLCILAYIIRKDKERKKEKSLNAHFYVAHPRTQARGALSGEMMGNRGGRLHNSAREIVRPYKSGRWITCVLEFRGRHRVVMSERRYTELFFLDEAVSLAAGHRPCAECRRERFNAFRDAWGRARNPHRLPFADEIDLELHAARIAMGRKVTYEASLASLPDGCFVQIEGGAYLVWHDALMLWAPDGYTRWMARPNDWNVSVLTPAPIVECLSNGFMPEIHESGPDRNE